MPNLEKFCSNPRRKHSKKIVLNLIKVTEELIRRSNGRVEMGTFVCGNCNTFILNNGLPPLDQNILEPECNLIEIEPEPEPMEIEQLQYSSSNESIKQNISKDVTEQLLPLLDQSPIKLRKFLTIYLGI